MYKRLQRSSLDFAMEQELSITFGAQNGRINHINIIESQLPNCVADLFHRRLLRDLILNDTAFADRFPSDFELRF